MDSVRALMSSSAFLPALEEWHARIAPPPVSYTHLDVYKRQVWGQLHRQEDGGGAVSAADEADGGGFIGREAHEQGHEERGGHAHLGRCTSTFSVSSVV